MITRITFLVALILSKKTARITSRNPETKHTSRVTVCACACVEKRKLAQYEPAMLLIPYAAKIAIVGPIAFAPDVFVSLKNQKDYNNNTNRHRIRRNVEEQVRGPSTV